MFPFLLLGQTASVDTPGLFAVANHGQVLLVRRLEARFAIIPATQAARGTMPKCWRALSRTILGSWPYRDGFMVYEQKGDLLFVREDEPPVRLAGPIPGSMPQLPLQWLGRDALGRPFAFVNAGGDTTYSGLAVLTGGRWRVSQGDPKIKPEDSSGRMFGGGSVGVTPNGFWFPNRQRRAYYVSRRRLRDADFALELTAADSKTRAYALQTKPYGNYFLVTVRNDRIRIGRFAADTYLDPRRCFVPSEDCVVDFGYAEKGVRLAVSRVDGRSCERHLPPKFHERKAPKRKGR